MTQIPLSSGASAERPQADLDRDDNTREIVSEVAYRQLAIVNVVFVGIEKAGDGNWVLVDAGIPGSARAIRSAARARFGAYGRPACIVMTHAHFDHVGALETLANEWTCRSMHIPPSILISTARGPIRRPIPALGAGCSPASHRCFQPSRSTSPRGCTIFPRIAACPSFRNGDGFTRPAIRPAMCHSGANATRS
jgi:glyoxylase-like metal-dependent hydrolase (beta-lactamase superfamily II)